MAGRSSAFSQASAQAHLHNWAALQVGAADAGRNFALLPCPQQQVPVRATALCQQQFAIRAEAQADILLQENACVTRDGEMGLLNALIQ